VANLSDSKPFALSVTLLFALSILSFSIPLGLAQSGTNESGIINSDTTWTMSGSPYNLVGNVLVNNGVTLTVEAGVTVNLNSYYMVINGTLQARGTSASQIRFNDGIKNYDVLRFNSLNDYDETTGTGNILDHTYFSGGIGISNGSSPRIVNGDLSGVSVWYGGEPIISNNQISAGVYVFGTSGSAQITYNTIKTGEIVIENSGVKAIITNNNILAQDGRNGISSQGDVIITDNSISNGISASGSFKISNNNIISGGISISEASGTISHNSINGAIDGIKISPSYYRVSNLMIQDNVIYDCSTGVNDVSASSITLRQTVSSQGTVDIQRNLIRNNNIGIACSSDDNLTIVYNTIIGNNVGISAPATSTTIANNNIHDNNINAKATTANADAKNNWWGTSDTKAIKQKIYDFSNDFNLGTINFTPFLTSPNNQAPSIDASISTPVTSLTQPSASPTPNVPEFPIVGILILFAGISLTTLVIRRRNSHLKSSKTL
jgi:hypothetical protein